MRTTLDIDDDLLAAAREFTGETKSAKLVHLALCALIEREASKCVSRMGASMPKLTTPSRRRSSRVRR
jgi:Arc/MetJ family transcription regulator